MIQNLEDRIRKLEEWMHESNYDTRHQIRSELYQRYRMEIPTQSMPHLFSALCVNTIDPMAEGQVQYYTPAMTAPGTQIGGLPWAYPVSPFGGFDDCGVTWVPPAGSKLALLCENGDRNQAYYIGTFYTGTRGLPIAGSNQEDEGGEPPDQDNSRLDLWGYAIPEYDCVWEGTRDGYLLGSNKGDQVKMPWNTDNYQTKDWDTQDDFDPNPESNQFITYPHQYGFKTPEKHYLKMVDGDHKCNHRYRRLELATGRTNMLMMKDDHLHPASQWAFGENSTDQCHTPMSDFTDCTQANESAECDDFEFDSESEFTNQFFKRQEEMRFYKAPPSLEPYGNPKCELPQSGIQLQSISGMQFVMDDSVEQPEGEPRWNLDFSWGCSDVFKGKMFMRSTTGHVIELNDDEDDTLVRSKLNGIRIQTATGNKIELNDHTLGEKENPTEAGDRRGIFMKSTSQHVLEMHDEGNEQTSLPRQQPQTDEDTEEIADITINQADKAFILLRSGYGLQLRMDDGFSQQETDQQYIQLLAPQKDNEERGPHQMIFQEKPEGPGLVLLRAGGVYYRSSYDDAIEVVGDENNPEPSNKFVEVTGNYIVDVEQYYFHHNDLTIFQAEKYIILFAGRDCPLPDNPEEAGGDAGSSAQQNVQIAAESLAQGTPNELPLNKGPCLFPVVVGKDPFVCPFTGYIHYGVMTDPADPTHTKLLHNSLSDRVFASASQAEADKQEDNDGGGDF